MNSNKIKFKPNQILKNYTYIKIGGKANYFLIADNNDTLSNALEYCKGDFYLLGGGSNLLIKDSIIKKPVIKLGKGFNYIKHDKQKIEVGAATPLAALLSFCCKYSIAGFENLAGIPATIGGLLAMNASAFGKAISSMLSEVEVIQEDGKIIRLQRQDIEFGYRSSTFLTRDAQNCRQEKKVILRAWFNRESGRNIKEKINSFLQKRFKTQDSIHPSCGCIFKNPSGDLKLAAGFLIDSCGLKGLCKNDAQISPKHANFIINLGAATYNDVNYLIKKMKDSVYRKFAVSLEEEVERWG